MRDSLARIFQSPVLAQALQGSEADCGERLSGSLARYDPESCSWKTAQQSLLGDSELYSETWPSWGTTQDGVFYPLLPLVPRTYALDGGASPDWQTPVADDAANRAKGEWNSRGEPKLSAQVMVPTPTVCGNYNSKGASQNSGDGLATYVKMWPTPRARECNPEGLEAGRRRDSPSLSTVVRTPALWPTQTKSDGTGGPGCSGREGGENLRTAVNGQLNPTWVEWLMGWPIGATELKLSEMDKYPSRLLLHMCCSMPD
jgi:hypothetical protein